MKFRIALSMMAVICMANISKAQNISIKMDGGFDIPVTSNEYQYINIKTGLSLGACLSYRFHSWGIGLDYQYIENLPISKLGSRIWQDSSLNASLPQEDEILKVKRHFFGIGPEYYLKLSSKANLIFASRFGYSLFTGGEVMQRDDIGLRSYRLLFGGFDQGALSGKLSTRIDYQITGNLNLSFSTHFIYNHQLKADNHIGSLGEQDFVYGHSNLEKQEGKYYLNGADAQLIESTSCFNYSSFGLHLGLTYNLRPQSSTQCEQCECPNDKHGVIVEVKDELSGVVIPNADVVLLNNSGDVFATGTTNTFGLVEFGEIPHGDYRIEGKLLDIQTTYALITESDFESNQPINRTLLYQDLRFILKGVARNKSSKEPESNVVVSLTKTRDLSITQDNSDGRGQFAFKLEKNSSYTLVGVKENRLSEIERASTVGLNRSTTLFVDLELGLDNFDCGKGTILDIKYEFDRDDLLAESKFELDRLIRYMNDHEVSKVELSSHTDSRGSSIYNEDLSQRRAQSAVNYILSKGISRDRIKASGYGEKRLLNNCSDGVSCTEEEHRINRRTEAQLICQ